MMIGPRVRYCVTFAPKSKIFSVIQAKYIHNFKVTVDNTNLEGSKVLEIKSMDLIMCSRKDCVYLYDSYTYKEKGKLEITLLKSIEREPNQVLALEKCQNE